MPFTENTVSTPADATLALWHAAETGNVDELVSVLPRVTDIDARNEHGVTALMRAAQHGRLRAVRVLLDHGADANIIRNDKFTALALAAFFGHTEVVRALMENGADLQASTRHGTSPHMWATARTFNEVVDELENPAPPFDKPVEKPVERPTEKFVPLVQKHSPVVERPAASASELVEPVSRAVARTAASAAVIRTLKDPPEIWDLVHEVPKGFDARSAFLARLGSMRTAFAFRAVMVIVLASVCAAVVVWLLRGAQARSEVTTERRSTPAATVESAPSGAAANPANPSPGTAGSTAAPGAAAADPGATMSMAPGSKVDVATPPETLTDKPVFTRRRPSRSSVQQAEQPAIVATNDVSQPTPSAQNVKSTQQTRIDQVITSKNTAPLSPQLITPMKSATPKPKVIQWP
jgi:hypothetical protein